MDGPQGDGGLIGTTLSHYLILAKLGEGGMGVVYRVRDLHLNREVALKLLPPSASDDPGARDRLLREARTASRLNHPHVCTIHEVGEAEGRVFIAMEFVEGRPLKALIPEGGMAAETVARYGAQIARALEHAHEHHVVHRDLKTANVVVAAGGQTKLLDFGLSRRTPDEAAGESGAGTQTLSSTGAVVGTPQYIAPEVLLGHAADARSDTWALGVVLYEMCAGRVPFGAGGVPGIVAGILHSTPDALPERVPVGLRSVVMRCLAKDPAQRYQHAGEVAAALEAMLPESDATPAGPRPAGRARGLSVRRVLVPLGIVAIVAAAAAAAWHFVGPRREAGVAQANRVLILPMEVRGQVQGADFAGRAFAEALAVTLAQTGGVRIMPVPSSREVSASGNPGSVQAALRAGASRLIVGALTREGDSLRASVSLIDAQANQVLWGEQRTGSGSDLALLASSLALRIGERLGAPPSTRYDYFMYVTGSPSMATSPELTEALGAVRRYELPQSLVSTLRLIERFPREPDAHVLRVAALLIDGRFSGPDSPQARAIADELDVLHRIDPGNPWYDVARAMRMPGDGQGIRLLGRVLARSDLTPAARGAVLAVRADVFGIVMRDTSAALADAEQAIRLDPASDLSLSTLARWLSNRGRYAEAAERVRQAVALNPTVVNYWLQLGNCMLKQGRWEEYVADLDQAARLSPQEDAVLSAKCDGLSCVGRYREAAACARRALRLRPTEGIYGLQLALCLMRLGEWEESLPLLERACREGSPAGCSVHAAASAVVRLRAGDEAPAMAQARQAASASGTKSGVYALACYHARRGDRDEAIRLIERFQEKAWVEPALDQDPNLATLRTDPRFRRLAASMRGQPIARVFAGWGQSR